VDPLSIIIIITALFIIGRLKLVFEVIPVFFALLGLFVPQMLSIAIVLATLFALYELFHLSAKCHTPTICRYYPGSWRIFFRLAITYIPLIFYGGPQLAAILRLTTYRRRGGPVHEILHIESLFSHIMALIICFSINAGWSYQLLIYKELLLGGILALIFGRLHPRLLFLLPFLIYPLARFLQCDPLLSTIVAGLVTGHLYRAQLASLMRQHRSVGKHLVSILFFAMLIFWKQWWTFETVLFALGFTLLRLLGYLVCFGSVRQALFATVNAVNSPLSIAFALIFLKIGAMPLAFAAIFFTHLLRLVLMRFVSLEEEPEHLGVPLCR